MATMVVHNVNVQPMQSTVHSVCPFANGPMQDLLLCTLHSFKLPTLLWPLIRKDKLSSQYVVCHTPGYPLHQCISIIWQGLLMSKKVAHLLQWFGILIGHIEPLLGYTSHLVCQVFVWRNQLHIDRPLVFLDHLFHCALPSSHQHLTHCFGTYPRFACEGVTARATHKESVFMCKLIACHWRAKLRPLITGSRSTKLICWVSFVDQSQHVSSNVLSFSSITPVTRQLASTPIHWL